MKSFLQQVAQHYFGRPELCFIFPNRRALSFFRKDYAQLVKESGKAAVLPLCCTMNDFFYSAAKSTPADQVQLLLALYDSYRRLNPQAESLDDFIFWGEVLLGDFNDIDKYLVPPERIFANIADFRAMQDSLDYLEPSQKEAIERFVGHFEQGGRYKDEFRRIWDILLPLYRDFNSSLSAQGLCYEGQVYRSLAERLKIESASDVLSASYPSTESFVFVGLNALNECEKLLLSRLRDARKAEFCWDFSSKWIRDSHNKSSLFLSANVAAFPQAFQLDPEGLKIPEINVLSVPSSVGQAKQLPAILKAVGAKGIDTAVVLPDEGLLLPVLNSIPEQLSEINVTMGYPMSGSALWSLMSDIAALQLHLRRKDEGYLFYHRQVVSILSNSLWRSISTPEDEQLSAKIRAERKFYLSTEELNSTPLFAAAFQAVASSLAEASEAQIEALQTYLLNLLEMLAGRLRECEGMSLELDFVREYYLAIGRLRACHLPVLPATWFRLLDKLVGRSSVPFEGEPLKGLQIMGPLETRALDFEKLIIFNANEGIFPRRSFASSFIPPELRAGFCLPTYEYQDAVWAYYFYRMIQRAEKVWILFDSRTEGLRNGEESRYIKQLELHFGAKIHRYEAKSPIGKRSEDESIPKTDEDMEILRSVKLSATTLQNYLSCPARFYYSKIRGLEKSREVSEYLDAGMIGNVYHKVMQDLYTREDRRVPKSYLLSVLRDEASLKQRVREAIVEEQKSDQISGRNLIFEELILRYIKIALRRDLEYMDTQAKDSIEILGLEQNQSLSVGGFEFTGKIDRLDRMTPGSVRVVDYKTGAVKDEEYLIDDDNAAGVVEALFGPNDHERPKIALQLYIYDLFVSARYPGKNISNSIYSPSRLSLNPVEDVSLSPNFLSLMRDRLSALLSELSDQNVPFERTQVPNNCKYCDFKAICGR